MNQTPDPSQDYLSLDELIDTVSRELRAMGLDTLPDRRASLLPDVRMVRYYTTLGLLNRRGSYSGRRSTTASTSRPCCWSSCCRFRA